MGSQLNNSKTRVKGAVLPDFFQPIMWSYDFSQLDPEKHKKSVILNAINYGDLKHWKWLSDYYGVKIIQETLCEVPVSEIRPRVLKLVSLIFNLSNFNYAPRGIK